MNLDYNNILEQLAAQAPLLGLFLLATRRKMEDIMQLLRDVRSAVDSNERRVSALESRVDRV